MIGATFRYLGALILLLLCYIGGVTLFPIAYLLRRWKDYYPLWWWFDDEDGLYGADYWREANNITKKNFWVAWRWAIRNPMWNAHTKIIPRSGLEFPLHKYGKLIHNFKVVDLMNSAVFHYVDDDGSWNGNVGECLSKKHSYIGWAFVIFEKQGVTYWRFSFAKQLIGPLGLEIQIGAFHRYIFKIKLKWNKKVFDHIPLTEIPHEAFVTHHELVLPKRDFKEIVVSKYIINY